MKKASLIIILSLAIGTLASAHEDKGGSGQCAKNYLSPFVRYQTCNDDKGAPLKARDNILNVFSDSRTFAEARRSGETRKDFDLLHRPESERLEAIDALRKFEAAQTHPQLTYQNDIITYTELRHSIEKNHPEIPQGIPVSRAVKMMLSNEDQHELAVYEPKYRADQDISKSKTEAVLKEFQRVFGKDASYRGNGEVLHDAGYMTSSKSKPSAFIFSEKTKKKVLADMDKAFGGNRHESKKVQ